ncbi:MAG: RDD family protein [Phycisphaerae bacterium]
MGIYGAIFEAAMSATPGKRALRLTVVRADGRPIAFGGALVRNLARAVEFHFVPLVLLVAVTFGKQRLGDLLARSYVVEPTETTLLSLDMNSDDDSDFD